MDKRNRKRLALILGAAALALLLFSAVFAAGETLNRAAVTGGLALCSGANCAPQAQSTLGASQPVTVEVRDNFFTPDPITLTIGTTVRWVRIGVFSHNVDADDGSFTSGPATSSWTSYEHTFNTAGTFLYHCEVHGGPGGLGMSGTVIVQGPPVALGNKVFVPVLLKQ